MDGINPVQVIDKPERSNCGNLNELNSAFSFEKQRYDCDFF
jgi:hypothetical protein